jgi:hypothetical protein
LKIRFCDLFRFAFDEIISISWLESRGCRVNPGLPKLFFVVLFFIEFYFSTLGWLGIELHNLSQFYFIMLSWSHNSSHEFNKLTWVDSNHFLGIFFINFFLFHPSALGLLKIEFCNLFWFAFYKVIMISYLGIQIGKLTRVVSIFIKKNLILNIYFESNCLFTYHLGCLFRPAKVIKSH